MNMNDFYFEAADYSNYDGSELNESNYFAQGGLEAAMQNIVEPLDRTLTFRVTNAGPTNPAVAILFDGNVTPLVQPAGVTVTVQETGGGAGSHDQVRTETLGNPFVIQGLRYFVNNASQYGNAFTIQKRFPTGKLIQYLWQPTNYVSPTNLNPLVIDAIDFGLVVDGRTSIQVPVDFLGVTNTLTLTFTLKAKTSNAHMLFGKNPKELAIAPRVVGNPVADIALVRSQPRSLGM
jgi:hypothetical protein